MKNVQQLGLDIPGLKENMKDSLNMLWVRVNKMLFDLT